MRKLEDDYSPEEIQQMRDAMDQLRQSQFENKQRAQQVYQEMKGREPELWKAFGFAHEGDYLVFNGLTDLINSDL